MTEKVSYSVEGPIGEFTLDRPEKYNCLDIETLDGLLDGIRAIEENSNVGVLTIRGAGEAFSAGADLGMFLEAIEAGDRGLVDEFIRKIHRVTRRLEKLNLPVIAAVDGVALAGGFELLLSTDLRIVTESASIGDHHAQYGLVAGGGGTQRLVRQVDTAVAHDLMFTGRRITGQEAVEFGIANRAVPAGEFESAVTDLEETLTRRSQDAAALTKRLMREGQAAGLKQGLSLERFAVIEYYFSEDAQRGFRAFAENRTPEF